MPVLGQARLPHAQWSIDLA